MITHTVTVHINGRTHVSGYPSLQVAFIAAEAIVAALNARENRAAFVQCSQQEPELGWWDMLNDRVFIGEVK